MAELGNMDQAAASRAIRDELHKVLNKITEMAPGLGVQRRETFMQILMMEAGFTFYERFGKPDNDSLQTILSNVAGQMITTDIQTIQ